MKKREILDVLAVEYWRHVKNWAKRKIEGEILAGPPPYAKMLNDAYHLIFSEKKKANSMLAHELVTQLEEYKAVCLIEYPVFIENKIWTVEMANLRFASTAGAQRWLCHKYRVPLPIVTEPKNTENAKISET